LCLSGCGQNPPAGYVQVDDAYAAKIPAQPITAVISTGSERVPVQVDSVMGCVAASRNMEESALSTLGAYANNDDSADCLDRKGNILLLIDNGKLYVKRTQIAPAL
jgi:hypothetical protein